jgi:hypothetical protein
MINKVQISLLTHYVTQSSNNFKLGPQNIISVYPNHSYFPKHNFKQQRTHLNAWSQRVSAVYFSVCIYEDKTDIETVVPSHIQVSNATTCCVCIYKTFHSWGIGRCLAHLKNHSVAVIPNSSARYLLYLYLGVLSVLVILLQPHHAFL